MLNPLELLKKYFGYDSFRPLQEKIIDTVLKNQDCLVLMPTGGGKSVCFQIPALAKEGITIVISPLISLMKDQVEALQANGVSAAYLNSSLDSDQEYQCTQNLIAGKIKLLYLSPEKTVGMLNGFLQNLQVSLIAIDEAHCISQWGHDFRPEYTQLNKLKEHLPGVPIIALTATADRVTRKDILLQLGIPEAEVFISSFDRPNLSLAVKRNVPERFKKEEIIDFIRNHSEESGIIYCLSRKTTESLCDELRNEGIDCKFYHAGMSSEERSKVQEEFIKDQCRIICATIAFGMGIDKSNVRWVIHYNLPKNIESYYQEIGRAGRDGLPSTTLLYYNIKDLVMLSKFAAESGRKEVNLEKLNRMQQYAESSICRRRILLNYFSEVSENNCNNCDACKNPAIMADLTELCQKAISCVIRTNQKIGITMLIQVLRGMKSQELIESQYHLIKTYGAGRDLSQNEWMFYILQMLQAGVFEMAYDEGFSLKITSLGHDIVYNQKRIQISKYIPKSGKNDKPPIQQEKEVRTEEILYDKELFNLLRTKRLTLAQSKGLPPYIIFHDSSLIQMAILEPLDRREFLRVSGVSQSKMNQYGEDFINIIRQYKNLPKLIDENPLEDALSDYKIKEYIFELRNYSAYVDKQILSKVLLKSRSQLMTREIQELEIYGLLKDVISKEELDRVIDEVERKNPDWFSTSDSSKVLSHFKKEQFNQLDDNFQQKVKNWIQQQRILRSNENIDNPYILETRKEFRRAYEPWSEDEKNYLILILKGTNDISLITQLLQRNESNIRGFIKQNITTMEIEN